MHAKILQAPGEAEAELAMLSELGVIDMVITSDSNTFIFGAQCVLRRWESVRVFEVHN